MKKSGTNDMFLGSMLTGLAPRSNDTAIADRYVRDGHQERLTFDAAVVRDREKLLEAQDGNFVFRSGGQLDWRDMLRPIAWSFGGFSRKESRGEDAIGPVTRYLRTDTFYRRPALSGEIGCTGNELGLYLPALGTDSVAFLPAPYAFSKMVDNSHYASNEELGLAYAKAIVLSVPSLIANGYNCMVLVEPFVGYEQSKGTFESQSWFQRPISAMKTPGMRLGIMFPLAEAAEVVPLVENSAVDFVGIDAVSSSGFKINTRKDVLIGVVSGDRAGRIVDGKIVVESQERISRLVAEFISEAQFSGRYYIGPNDRLYDVPFEHAVEKIRALSRFGGTD